MDRRWFLSTAAGVTAALAGCGGAGSGTTPTATDAESATPSSSTDTPDELATARDYLRRAADRFSTEADEFGDVDEGASFDTAAIFAALDRADEALASAEASVSDADRRETVSALQSVSAFLRALTEALVDYEGGLSRLSTATTYTDNERYEDAISASREAKTAIEEGQDHLSTADDRRDDIAAASLESVDEVSVADLEEKFAALEQVMDAVLVVVDGYVDFNRGLVDYASAVDAADGENWGDAADGFDSAATDLDRARTHFESGEDEAPPGLTDSFIELTCAAGSLRDASREFERAMQAAQRGDQSRYEDHVEQAEDAANRCSVTDDGDASNSA